MDPWRGALRAMQELPTRVGSSKAAAFLVGKEKSTWKKMGGYDSDWYGCMRSLTTDQAKALVEHFIESGYLQRDTNRILSFTEIGEEVVAEHTEDEYAAWLADAPPTEHPERPEVIEAAKELAEAKAALKPLAAKEKEAKKRFLEVAGERQETSEVYVPRGRVTIRAKEVRTIPPEALDALRAKHAELVEQAMVFDEERFQQLLRIHAPEDLESVEKVEVRNSVYWYPL